MSAVGRIYDRMRLAIGVTYSTATGRYEVFSEADAEALVEELSGANLVVGFNVKTLRLYRAGAVYVGRVMAFANVRYVGTRQAYAWISFEFGRLSPCDTEPNQIGRRVAVVAVVEGWHD